MWDSKRKNMLFGSSKMLRKISILAIVFAMLFNPYISAEEGESTWFQRETLFGDWGGMKTSMNDRGINVSTRITHFLQGLASGDGDDDFENGGKWDLFVNLNGSKLGLWNGVSLTVHGEANFGNDVNHSGGTLLPVNTALLFLDTEGSDARDLTSVFIGQKVDDNLNLMFGKINMVDVVASKPFKGGAGIDSFQNLAFVVSPNGLIPAVIFGALIDMKTEPAKFTFAVYDPKDASNKTGFEDPFGDGVSFMSGIDFPVRIAGRSGTYGIKAFVSTRDGIDLRDVPGFLLPEEAQPLMQEGRPYFLGFAFDQYLFQNSDNLREGWGIFGQIGMSDGNPTPIDWSWLVGVGGTSPVPGRHRDKFGIGFFHYSLSNHLKDSLKPIFSLDEEQGWEIFYNCAITPWLNITSDLQIIDPYLNDRGTATVLGLRTTIKL
jgi:porin